MVVVFLCPNAAEVWLQKRKGALFMFRYPRNRSERGLKCPTGLRYQGGLTLLELIAVLAIISILAAIGVPSFINIKDNSLIGTTEANLVIIRKALNNYMVDSPNNHFPMGSLDYGELRSLILFANLPEEESDAKILGGSFHYNGDGLKYNLSARSTNSYNQEFTATPTGIVRN